MKKPYPLPFVVSPSTALRTGLSNSVRGELISVRGELISVRGELVSVRGELVEPPFDPSINSGLRANGRNLFPRFKNPSKK